MTCCAEQKLTFITLQTNLYIRVTRATAESEIVQMSGVRMQHRGSGAIPTTG